VIAAIYARKSTDQCAVADEAKSVRRQIDHARAYALKKGWTVDEAYIYVDDGISGAEFARRPGFMRLMNALAPRPPFQVLVMSEESRLGREAIETAYALKQIIAAGVRVFFYLEDRERTLDSPIEKVMLSLQTMADEMEREKARQRAWDAALRRTKSGHVAGGRVFGYENVRRNGQVKRRIVDAEAAVVRRIFELSVAGYGMKAIAKQLNTESAPSPRSQQGRSRSWVATSVREALHRDLYRGVVTWNRTRKRDRWGAHHQTARPATDWIDVPAPALQIVSSELWDAVHARLSTIREILTPSGGRPFGRPPLGGPSKYLLTNLGLCGCCGGPLRARSRKDAAGRYGCSWYHERGTTVCTNNADVPMADADAMLIDALLDDVLDKSIIADAVDEALGIIEPSKTPTSSFEEPVARIEKELQRVEYERQKLMAAITSGRTVTGLLEALQALEHRKVKLESELAAIDSPRPVLRIDTARVRRELLELAGSWRQVLADDPTNARPIVTSLLIGRVTIAPTTTPREWQMRGEGTLVGLFERTFPLGWRPRAEFSSVTRGVL
jgi:site-specific DNA recombinase